MRENERFIIYSYTAEQAVQDGILFEVDAEVSREVGYLVPVRITAGVHAIVGPKSEGDAEAAAGRLRDALQAAREAILKSPEQESITPFDLTVGEGTVRLWACLDGTSGPALHIITPAEY